MSRRPSSPFVEAPPKMPCQASRLRATAGVRRINCARARRLLLTEHDRRHGLLPRVVEIKQIVLVGASGKTLANMPVAGATPALRFIDDYQNRAGTVPASVARQPAPAVAPPPVLPIIVSSPVPLASPCKMAGCRGDEVEQRRRLRWSPCGLRGGGVLPRRHSYAGDDTRCL